MTDRVRVDLPPFPENPYDLARDDDYSGDSGPVVEISPETGGIELTPFAGPLTEAQAAAEREETLHELGNFAAGLPTGDLDKLLEYAMELYKEAIARGDAVPEDEADA